MTLAHLSSPEDGPAFSLPSLAFPDGRLGGGLTSGRRHSACRGLTFGVSSTHLLLCNQSPATGVHTVSPVMWAAGLSWEVVAGALSMWGNNLRVLPGWTSKMTASSRGGPLGGVLERGQWGASGLSLMPGGCKAQAGAACASGAHNPCVMHARNPWRP